MIYWHQCIYQVNKLPYQILSLATILKALNQPSDLCDPSVNPEQIGNLSVKTYIHN